MLILTALTAVPAAVPAGEPPADRTTPPDGQPDRMEDETAIKQLGKDWQDAWNRRDAHALTALLAEAVDFVSVLGPKGWLKGRARFKEHTPGCSRRSSRTAGGPPTKST